MSDCKPEFQVEELKTVVTFEWSTDDFLSYWEDNGDKDPTPGDYYAWVKGEANELEYGLRYTLASTDISHPPDFYFEVLNSSQQH
jgi:hypothetical protein